jgi:HSP20 family protein
MNLFLSLPPLLCNDLFFKLRVYYNIFKCKTLYISLLFLYLPQTESALTPFTRGWNEITPFGFNDPFGTFLTPFAGSNMLKDLERLQRQLAFQAPQTIAIDVAEHPDKFAISASVPGFNKDQVKVEVDEFNNMLCICAQKKEEKERKGYEEGMRVLRKERSSEFTERRFTLPSNVDSSKITSTLSNGVLHIDVPKNMTTNPRRIEIS